MASGGRGKQRRGGPASGADGVEKGSTRQMTTTESTSMMLMNDVNDDEKDVVLDTIIKEEVYVRQKFACSLDTDSMLSNMLLPHSSICQFMAESLKIQNNGVAEHWWNAQENMSIRY